jgi:hypothetical protein
LEEEGLRAKKHVVLLLRGIVKCEVGGFMQVGSGDVFG